MFTMETTNPTHFQLYIQITHYADISRYTYCTERKFYCTISHMLQVTTVGKRFSLAFNALVTVKIVQMNCIKS